MLTLVILGLSMGIVFGVALEKSRVFEAGIIIRQLELKNFILFKVFLSAIATTIVVVALMNFFLDIQFSLKPIHVHANVLGGAIVGLGIALSGACPGTVLAQIGVGYKDAIICFIGGIFGAAAFGFVKEPLLDPIYFAGEGPKIQLHSLFGMEYWAAANITVLLIIIILLLLEKRQKWREEIGRNYDGVS